MVRSTGEPDFAAAGFFVFRTPLLPIEELEALSDALQAPAVEDPGRLAAALEADRTLLRQRLQAFVERPEVGEALFVASPSLVESLGRWRETPDSKNGRRTEEALVRYVQRMMTRATPFGLFSGCSVGRVGAASRLVLAPRRSYRRHTRLDMDFLFALAEDLGRFPELRRRLRLTPNSSLYLAAGRWRYVEARLDGRIRSHHLVAVETTPYLESTLERAGRGATGAELAAALVDADPDGEVTAEEAEEFVFELIETQMLTNGLSPRVTGPEPVHELVEKLAAYDESRTVSERLAEARDTLAELDAAGLGQDPERYRGVARRLEELPTRLELPRLFQVDVVKPAVDATLGPAILAEIERGVTLLARLAGAAGEDSLSRFRKDFQERYEAGGALPLVEVLDEEVGIGFGGSPADPSDLLAGLGFPPRPPDPSAPWDRRGELLLRKVERAWSEGAREIELTAEDLRELDAERQPAPPLPDSFQALATVAAPGRLDDEKARVFLKGVSGPSGAQLLGRFCHSDPQLRQHVESLLREEERRQPEAVFAEIVHLPEGRVGNILLRPLLRGYEIPFLGRGGGDAQHQIPITDLLVSVAGDEIVLSSKRLGRRVLPRLTSAHNFSARSLGVYRFLCALQFQRVSGGLSWSWGVLEGLAFLPRVSCGRLVLSRARWRVTGQEIGKLLEGGAARRFLAFRTWRRERRLPRRVLLIDSDNELLVDFENVLSLEAFTALVRNRELFQLVELFPPLDELPVSGPEGRFVCELVIPFLRRYEAPAADTVRDVAPRRRTVPSHEDVRRGFAPGSEWLYAKLYTGTSTADSMLADVIGPLARRMTASGAADRWFFVRYGDPHWHLRLRFHGAPEALHGEVLPALQAAVAPLLDDGRMWRFGLDTYQREVERYGGGHGVVLAERLAHADSEAVLTLVEHLAGDEGAAVRWRLALRGVDQLIRDLVAEDEERLRLLTRLQRSYAREFRVDTRFKKQLADRLRAERRELEELLDAPYDPEHPLAPGLAALDHRSAAVVPLAAELREHAAAGRLMVDVTDLTASFVHMFNNRLIRSDHRAHEVVLYDFLHRLALSRAARARRGKP